MNTKLKKKDINIKGINFIYDRDYIFTEIETNSDNIFIENSPENNDFNKEQAKKYLTSLGIQIKFK